VNQVASGLGFTNKERNMLILKRNLDQSITIGSNITIMVTDIGPTWVKLGITAPREVPVLRDDAKATNRKEPNQCDS